MPLPARLALVALPVAEVVVAVVVARVLGAWPTLGLLLLSSLAGLLLVRRQGRRAWRALQASVDGGRLPPSSAVDGVLAFAGGLLLLAPGFLSAVVGLLLLFGPTRSLFRGLVAGWAARRVIALGGPGTLPRQPGFGVAGGATRAGPDFRHGDVVPGEVVSGEVASDDDEGRRR